VSTKIKGNEACLHGLDSAAGAGSLNDSLESVARRKHVAFSSTLAAGISGAWAWELRRTQEAGSSERTTMVAACPAALPAVADEMFKLYTESICPARVHVSPEVITLCVAELHGIKM